MNETMVLEVGREATLVVLKTAAPVMLVGLTVGLVIAFFQALTTIQEMTLTFVPKILIILLALLLFLPFMMNTMIAFGRTMFDHIIALG